MIYDAICHACGHQEEIIKSMSEPFPAICPKCGSTTEYHQNYAKKNLTAETYVLTAGKQSEINRKEMGEEQWGLRRSELMAGMPTKSKINFRM